MNGQGRGEDRYVSEAALRSYVPFRAALFGNSPGALACATGERSPLFVHLHWA